MVGKSSSIIFKAILCKYLLENSVWSCFDKIQVNCKFDDVLILIGATKLLKCTWPLLVQEHCSLHMVPGISHCSPSKGIQISELAECTCLQNKWHPQQSRADHLVSLTISQCTKCSFDVWSHDTELSGKSPRSFLPQVSVAFSGYL